MASSAPHYRDDHEIQRVEILHHGHHHAGIELCPARLGIQFPVQHLEPRLCLPLVSEYLHHFLAAYHLLDVTVHLPERSLLGSEIPAAATGYEIGEQEHQGYHDEHGERQERTDDEHEDEDARKRKHGGEHIGQVVGEHLRHSVHVVRVTAHHITVRMRIEITHGQGLHLSEEVHPQAGCCPLSYPVKHPVLQRGRNDSCEIDCRKYRQHTHQTRHVARHDVIVDYRPEHIRPHEAGGYRNHHEHQHHSELPLATRKVRDQAPERFSALLRPHRTLLSSAVYHISLRM